MQRDSRTLRSSFIPLQREKCCTYLVVLEEENKQSKPIPTYFFFQCYGPMPGHRTEIPAVTGTTGRRAVLPDLGTTSSVR
jgi:hypothetical protein